MEPGDYVRRGLLDVDGDTPLPDHIVKRFAGKVIAITGYEQDQVMVEPVNQGRPPGQGRERADQLGVQPPLQTWMLGEHSYMTEVAAQPGDTSAHGAPTKWIAEDRPSAALRSDPDAPTSLLFSEGNGGESRKSFHGYPNKYAQLLESPTSWHLTPMQIDTRRRDCGVTRDDVDKCVDFEPWMEPKQARYGRKVEKANYSGILECPCNSRFGGDTIFYPTAQTKRVFHRWHLACGPMPASQGSNARRAGGGARRGRGAGAPAQRLAARPPARPAAPSSLPRTARSLRRSTARVACPSGGVRSGVATSKVNVTFNLTLDAGPAGGLATITLSGPAARGSRWGSVRPRWRWLRTRSSRTQRRLEQQIGTCGSEAEHCMGDRLPTQSLTMLSNTVTDGVRTLVLTRPFRGASPKHFTFDIGKLARLDCISAVGYDQTFAYHKAHHAATLSMLAPAGMPTCACDEGEHATLCHHGGGDCYEFVKGCVGPWDGKDTSWGGDLLQQRNPTCNSRQYAGGLTCCGHRRVMLDVEQDPGPSLLRYHMKFRFWFQEYHAGTPTPGAYVHRPGSLPQGFDLMPPRNATLSEALETCSAAKGCTGITFQGPVLPVPPTRKKKQGDAAAGSGGGGRRDGRHDEAATYFKNGTTISDGNPEWQYVVEFPEQSHHHLPRFYYDEANAGEYDIPPALRRRADPPIPGYPELPISTSSHNLHLTPGTTCKGGAPTATTASASTPSPSTGPCRTRAWSTAELPRAPSHRHRALPNDTGTPQLLCRQASRYGQGHAARQVRRERVPRPAAAFTTATAAWRRPPGCRPTRPCSRSSATATRTPATTARWRRGR